MYTIENIIRTLDRKPEDKLNIILVSDNYDDYVERLCETGHDFYIIDAPWHRDNRPANLNIVSNGSNLKGMDFIIVFNRAQLYESAGGMSGMWHLPLIVVDCASPMSKVQIPFFTTVNVNDEHMMTSRAGMVSVGTTQFITDSWLSPRTRFSTTIPIPHIQIDIEPNPTKVLIDKQLPQQYLESLPIEFVNERFTTAKEEAGIYLHLLQTVTPLMVDCMASKIPVVTFQSIEFNEIIEKHACIIMTDIAQAKQSTFVTGIRGLSHLPQVLDNAYDLVIDNTIDKFVSKWNRILNYTAQQFYLRG